MQGLKKNIPAPIIRSYIFAFSMGAVIYTLLETLYRLRTHFTMCVLGGICGVIIYHINRTLKSERFITKALMSTILITITELISGIFLNVILGLKVWDYSSLPLNFMGQICPHFCIIWFIITVPSLWLCNVIDKYLSPHLDGDLLFINFKKEADKRGSSKKIQEK